MKTEQLQTEIEKIESQGSHVAALIAALGNPSEWSYTGTCVDAGKAEAVCTCGHEIRFCFIITHPTRGQTQVGSTCINHIAEITQDLSAALVAARDQLESDLKATKAKARKAAADRENQQLWDQYSALRTQALQRYTANQDAGQCSPRDLRYFVEGWYEKLNRSTPPEYIRSDDLRRWLLKAISRVNRAIASD